MKLLKPIFFILILFTIHLHVNAQDVVYSPYEKFDVRGSDFAVVGKVGSRIYTYRGSADGFFLDAYDDKMDRLATVLLDFFPKRIYATKFIAYSNQIIVLYQSVEGNTVIQYAALLDDMGRLVKQPVKLDEEKTGLFGPNKEYFTSAISEDKKHIFIYKTEEKGSELILTGKWVDDQLNISERVTGNFSADNTLTNGEGMIANNGTFYLPVYTPIGGRSFADQLWLLELTKNNNTFKPVSVPLNNKFAAGVYSKIDNAKNRIYIGGFYSDKKNGSLEGVLYTYYDIANQSFESRKNIAFDEQWRLSTGERNKKRAFDGYQARQLIVKNDGGFVLIAEDYYITTRNNYSPGFGYYSMYYPSMGTSIREYHYNDILAMSYNSEGVKEWHTFIRKDQYSQEDGGIFSSYALLNTGGSLGFLFNDFNSARSRIQLATIDGGGRLEMRSLAANKSDDPDWLPRSGKQVSAREMVVPCLRKRQISFAKITF